MVEVLSSDMEGEVLCNMESALRWGPCSGVRTLGPAQALR